SSGPALENRTITYPGFHGSLNSKEDFASNNRTGKEIVIEIGQRIEMISNVRGMRHQEAAR
ncbi:MAG: hypothetical protein OXI63_09925, partial [Candidatus Poribacteria bacterium]|nr:hypothetical protein [Candidatus Poribacteria bacterium]